MPAQRWFHACGVPMENALEPNESILYAYESVEWTWNIFLRTQVSFKKLKHHPISQVNEGDRDTAWAHGLEKKCPTPGKWKHLCISRTSDEARSRGVISFPAATHSRDWDGTDCIQGSEQRWPSLQRRCCVVGWQTNHRGSPFWTNRRRWTTRDNASKNKESNECWTTSPN